MDPDKAKTTSAERPVLSPRQTALIVASLMLALALAALDATIVGTALPTIVADLGGVSLYSWLIAAYLLTSTTTVPLYGRVADMVGRKPVLLFGIVLFLAGSVLCGLAQSMVQLIIFRAVQGLGAGPSSPSSSPSSATSSPSNSGPGSRASSAVSGERPASSARAWAALSLPSPPGTGSFTSTSPSASPRC